MCIALRSHIDVSPHSSPPICFAQTRSWNNAFNCHEKCNGSILSPTLTSKCVSNLFIKDVHQRSSYSGKSVPVSTLTQQPLHLTSHSRASHAHGCHRSRLSLHCSEDISCEYHDPSALYNLQASSISHGCDVPSCTQQCSDEHRLTESSSLDRLKDDTEHSLKNSHHGNQTYQLLHCPDHRLSSSRCRPGEHGKLPARLAPESGILCEGQRRKLVKPIARKPVCPRQNVDPSRQCYDVAFWKNCSPHLSTHCVPVDVPHDFNLTLTCSSPSECSTDISHTSLTLGSVSVVGGSCIFSQNTRPTPSLNVVTGHNNNKPVHSVGETDVVKHCASAPRTSSPNNYVVGQLEAKLKEREAEILVLHQVMDQNECAILQVYEDKEELWKAEISRITEEYEHKLQAHEPIVLDLKRTLEQQIRCPCSHRQDIVGYVNVEHCNNLDASYSLKDSCSPYDIHNHHHPGGSSHHNVSLNQGHIDLGEIDFDANEVMAEMSMKNAEILNLRSQVSKLTEQVAEQECQLMHFRQQVRPSIKTVDQSPLHDQIANIAEGNDKTPFKTEHSSILHSDEEYTLSVERQVDELRIKIRDAESLVESERQQWLEEKCKVIRYQKQLQLNYVQMRRKNAVLEAEVEQLTMEIESHNLKMIALNSEGSVC